MNAGAGLPRFARNDDERVIREVYCCWYNVRTSAADRGYSILRAVD